MQDLEIIPIIETIFNYRGLTIRESHWFLEICSKYTGNFLNVGIASGSTVIMMAHSSPNAKIVAVDLYGPYIEKGVLHNYSASKDKYLKNLHDTGFEHRVDNYFMSSAEYFHLSNKKFDLIFLDGGHDYDVINMEIGKAWDRLNTGGVLMFHDFLPTNYLIDKRVEPGVTQAVWEFFGGKVLEAELHETLLCVHKFDMASGDRLFKLYDSKVNGNSKI
jgi:predicted O-methyltransferase YrrM